MQTHCLPMPSNTQDLGIKLLQYSIILQQVVCTETFSWVKHSQNHLVSQATFYFNSTVSVFHIMFRCEIISMNNSAVLFYLFLSYSHSPLTKKPGEQSAERTVNLWVEKIKYICWSGSKTDLLFLKYNIITAFVDSNFLLYFLWPIC